MPLKVLFVLDLTTGILTGYIEKYAQITFTSTLLPITTKEVLPLEFRPKEDTVFKTEKNTTFTLTKDGHLQISTPGIAQTTFIFTGTNYPKFKVD